MIFAVYLAISKPVLKRFCIIIRAASVSLIFCQLPCFCFSSRTRSIADLYAVDIYSLLGGVGIKGDVNYLSKNMQISVADKIMFLEKKYIGKSKVWDINLLPEQSLLNYKKMIIKANKTCLIGQLLFFRFN